MNTKSCLALVALLWLGAAVSPAATAGCAMELEVKESPGPKIRIYEAGGKSDGEIDRALLAKQPVLECDESLGLVKVKPTQQIAHKEFVWVNRGETRRITGVAQNPEVCVTESSSKDAGHTIGATNGADPTQVHCKSPK